MNRATASWRALREGWERFFHARVDARMYGLVRIGYAALLLVNFLGALPFVELFWGERGVLPFEMSRQVIDADTLTLFSILPRTDGALWTVYFIFLGLIACLLMGVLSRVMAVLVFVLLVSFQHRNNMILDGEDIVFRMFGFLLILMPIGARYSLDAWWRRRRRGKISLSGNSPTHAPIWPLRLMQIQVVLILLCSGLEKLNGSDWLNGSAMFYIMQLDDLFGRFPVPEFVRQSVAITRLMSWGALVVELLVPIFIWFRKTRRAALAAALALHLGIDYMMNLFLFEWIMALGWLTFLTRDDVRALRRLVPRRRDAASPEQTEAAPAAP